MDGIGVARDVGSAAKCKMCMGTTPSGYLRPMHLGKGAAARPLCNPHAVAPPTHRAFPVPFKRGV